MSLSDQCYRFWQRRLEIGSVCVYNIFAKYLYVCVCTFIGSVYKRTRQYECQFAIFDQNCNRSTGTCLTYGQTSVAGSRLSAVDTSLNTFIIIICVLLIITAFGRCCVYTLAVVVVFRREIQLYYNARYVIIIRFNNSPCPPEALLPPTIIVTTRDIFTSLLPRLGLNSYTTIIIYYLMSIIPCSSTIFL